MNFEFDEYLMSYVRDDDDDDNYNNSLMKLHQNCEYYHIEDMARFVCVSPRLSIYNDSCKYTEFA